MLGVTGGHSFGSWAKALPVSGSAEEIAAALPPSAYVPPSAGDGTRGPRLLERAYLELADLDAAAEGYRGSHGLWTRGLLIRRHPADRSLAFFTTWCPKGTPIEALARVEGRRWAIEDALRPRPNSVSTTTRRAAGTVGTAMSRWSCSPSPCWR